MTPSCFVLYCSNGDPGTVGWTTGGFIASDVRIPKYDKCLRKQLSLAVPKVHPKFLLHSMLEY